VTQVRLLARTFFGRLFESELMPPGLPQVQLVIWSAVLVATPALTLPGVYIYKYTGLWIQPGTLGPAIANDRLVLITIAMLAAGLVAVATWENALPDRRDVRILGVLPIPQRAFVAARLLALGCLFLLFFATLGFLPSLLFSALAWTYLEPGGLLRMAGAQLAATFAGSAAAFCGVLGLQCFVLVVFGRAVSRRVALATQLLVAVAIVQMIFVLPSIGRSMGDGALQPDWLSSSQAAMLPSVWYLALCDVLMGYGPRNAYPLATRAVAVTSVAILSAVGFYALGYRRMLANALESPAPDAPLRRAQWLMARRRSRGRYTGPRAVKDAVRRFALRTLARSRPHRTLLAIYLGLGFAIVVSSIVPLLLAGADSFRRPSVAVLAAPLVMMFAALVGMRVAFAIPVEVKANWVVRLREPREKGAAIEGALSAMLRAGVAPCVALAGLSTGPWWGWRIAAEHVVVCSIMGWLLAELLLLVFCKIPFTCTYFPGRSQVKTLWPFYLSAFLTCTYTAAGLEIRLLRWPRASAAVIAVLVGAALAARTLRRTWLDGEPGLRFAEDDPDALFEGFHLSEGLAAQLRPDS
jgi:hypothetical protein